MPDFISVTINGTPNRVARGTSIAAAMLLAAQPNRISITGQPRSALCGMGICFECSAVVNGTPHRRTCQIQCEPDMTVETDR
ncbi:MAG TPA: 2Fe-2S iron-sulfur cluster-binding protein [Acidobacteriaceae bacterium]|jgi:sarcosine oxidase subunit alpha